MKLRERLDSKKTSATCRKNLIDIFTISYLARSVKINGEKMVKKEAGFAPASMP